MKRFYDAIEAATGRKIPTLPWLATNLVEAIADVTLEGGTPATDPAVLLLGSFIAFHTHADVNTAGGYRKLIDLCWSQIAERPLQ